MSSLKLVAISGSLRKGSHNSALIHAFKERAPEGVEIEILEIGNLPLFNQDVEASAFPELATELKNKIRAADGILISTPEYNRSIPGVLKNAIDWASRPYGDNAFDAKPVYVMSASTGAIAGALAHYNLMQTMLYLNARLLGQPEFYCGNAGQKFNADGQLTDKDTQKHIDTSLAAFTEFVTKLK